MTIGTVATGSTPTGSPVSRVARHTPGDPTGKSVNPAGLGVGRGIENVFVETENAAGQVSLFIDQREQERVGIGMVVDRVGGKVATVDVVHGLVEIKKVEQQVEHEYNGAAIRRGSWVTSSTSN